MNKVWIVAKSVFLKQFKTFGYWMMLLMPVIMLAIIFGISYFIGSQDNQDSKEGVQIGIVGVQKTQEDALKQLQPSDEEWIFYSSEQEAQDQLGSKAIDGYARFDQGYLNQASFYQSDSGKNQSETSSGMMSLNAAITQLRVAQTAQQQRLTASQVQAITQAQQPLPVKMLHFEDGKVSEKDQNEIIAKYIKQGTAMAGLAIIFMVISAYANMIAQEISKEKGQHLMELILTTVSAKEHFYGKFLGMILLISLNILVYVLIGVAAWYMLPMVTDGIPEPLLTAISKALEGSDLLIIMTVVYTILALILYLGLAGFLGALATDVETAGKAMTPLVLLSIIGFYIGYIGSAVSLGGNGGNGLGIISQIGSYFPFFSPFVVPQLIANNQIGGIGIAVSIILLILTSVLIFWLSADFYEKTAITYVEGSPWKAAKRAFSVWKSERK